MRGLLFPTSRVSNNGRVAFGSGRTVTLTIVAWHSCHFAGEIRQQYLRRFNVSWSFTSSSGTFSWTSVRRKRQKLLRTCDSLECKLRHLRCEITKSVARSAYRNGKAFGHLKVMSTDNRNVKMACVADVHAEHLN